MFLRTLQCTPHHTPPVTLISIDDSTLLLSRIFIFGSHQKVFDSSVSFKVYLYPIFATNLLYILTQPTVIRNHNVRLLVDGIQARVSSVVIVLVEGWFLSDPVQGPSRVFAFSKCTMEMTFFLLQQLWIRADLKIKDEMDPCLF